MSSDQTSSTPKAIGSLAKRPTDTTRQGTHKLKFIPTLPQRRKKEPEVKSEPATPVLTPSTDAGRGRGRGRGHGRGEPLVQHMVASGPFAMGPSLAGASGRRTAPRSNFTPLPPPSSASTSTGLSNSGPLTLKKDAVKRESQHRVNDEEEVYSDADDGVEIVDMERIRHMDWMAPETLKKEQSNAAKTAKKEKDGEVDHVDNSVQSEPEADQELEDMIEDFSSTATPAPDRPGPEDRLYFFRFPSPFPTFISQTNLSGEAEQTPAPIKQVSFAPDVKGSDGLSLGSASAATESPSTQPLDGVIGQLEVYRSGAVRMRLANGVLMDVNTVTQPSFLQQAVYQDVKEHSLVVIGEVNKQFVVSPNVDALLHSLEHPKPRPEIFKGEEGLIKMDPV